MCGGKRTGTRREAKGDNKALAGKAELSWNPLKYEAAPPRCVFSSPARFPLASPSLFQHGTATRRPFRIIDLHCWGRGCDQIIMRKKEASFLSFFLSFFFSFIEQSLFSSNVEFIENLKIARLIFHLRMDNNLRCKSF